MSGWIDQIRDTPVAEVAEKLGYEVKRGPTASHCACPVCGAERRHTKSRDKRGAVGMPHGAGWRCWQCEAAGDAMDFVSYHLGDAKFRELDQERREAVKEWFGVSEPGPAAEPARKGPPRLAKQTLDVGWENADANYPPIGEVEALWGSCRPVDSDDGVLWYLGHRSITGVGKLAEHDAARALPLTGAMLPGWAHVGDRSWAETGHRLIVPLYDFQGTMRSVLARSVEASPRVKSVGATGRARRGLVMAGTYGRQMLVSGATRGMHAIENFRLSVWEGEIDTIRAISVGHDCEISEDFAPAAFRGVLGIFSGSFTRDVASRVPSQSTVVIATDDDDQGDRYAADIQSVIGDRVTYKRFRAPKD